MNLHPNPDQPLVLPPPWVGETFVPPRPLDLYAAQTAIVDRLQARLDSQWGVKAKVEHFPDDYKNYTFRHIIGAVLVRWLGAEYSELKAIDIVNQDRTMTWEIALLSRDLGWNYGSNPSAGRVGIYGMNEAVRLTLSGFQVPGFTKLHPMREMFRGYEDGVWAYAAHYAHKTGAVQIIEDVNAPVLADGAVQERGGQTDRATPVALFTFNVDGKIVLPKKNITAISVTDVTGFVSYLPGQDFALDYSNGVVSASGGVLGVGSNVLISFSSAERFEAVKSGGNDPFNPSN